MAKKNTLIHLHSDQLNGAGRSIFNKSINNPVWWDGSNWVSMRIIEPDTNNYIDCGTY